MNPYPLKFKPEMKERVWGGRNLAKFGLPLPDGAIGEAWTISDHPNGMTHVENGQLQGWGLDQIREKYGEELFGSRGFSKKTGRFPLLIKLLDCDDDLSVQVHPTDDYPRLSAGELGKTEMWYILDAKPGAKIIYGLKPGATRETLSLAISENRILDVMNQVEVKAGDSFYIPAGTVHALGAGILLAEIQQNSDTTYRLYDYDRLGLDGKLRPLHIEDSLNVIAYDGSGAARMTTEISQPNNWLTIASSPYFTVEKAIVQKLWNLSTTADSFVILVIAEGHGHIHWGKEHLSLQAGDCLLLPANLGSYSLSGELTVIRSYIPS